MTRSEITFLFTDIQDSTGLVRELGDRFQTVLADSRAILRSAVDVAGGRSVDCRADEFFAVFSDPRQAVVAALAAQRALVGHSWPDGADVRIRMGLHTGIATSDEQRDFVGLEVHRAARIAAAGHGGQVVMSEKTAALAGAPVRDLGLYQLDGLPEPERVFQLVDDGLPSEFPPLRCRRRCDGRQIRVALADDSVLVREGIARLLEEADIDVVAQAGTPDDLLREVETHEPDVAVVDIRMPPSGSDEGVRAAKEIRRRFPKVGVILLSQLLEPTYAIELIGDDANGVGYLQKDRVGDVAEFTDAITRVAGGGSALDPALVAELIPTSASSLSERDREILGLIAQGRSNEAIAERLFVPAAVAQREVASVLERVGLPAGAAERDRVPAVLTHLVGRRVGLGRAAVESAA
jgi:DNA-binding NarL/FixJ family response regulator/class 3 adenylate cyclase